ncbi:response regulator [Aeromonas hydrophila]|uniref:response regulator n=1 Tax=Aeromonas hydrophila TaxID=644 RepID=UPI000A710389|nr:response regulator [Aeromonas hydrophila]
MSEILIVDDMASNRYILRSLLEEAGYRVREATDGLQAVDAATEFPPDLVLMDINMPVMDGYEACRRIKQLPGQWCLPVLFISTNSGIGALEQAFQAGGCDYVSKPFHQLEVLARVQNQLRLKELGRQQAKVQLYQSLFQLTAGIAHEINTPSASASPPPASFTAPAICWPARCKTACWGSACSSSSSPTSRRAPNWWSPACAGSPCW